MTRLFLSAALLALSSCSGAELAYTCETIEPYRPLIRIAVVAVEPVAAIPFAVTRQISCADAEVVAGSLFD